MKKLNLKNILSTALDCLGVLLWIIGLCAGSAADTMSFMFVIIIFLVSGGMLIALSLKINPERSRKFFKDEYEEPVRMGSDEHNYSVDFEYLYNRIVEERVAELLARWGENDNKERK